MFSFQQPQPTEEQKALNRRHVKRSLSTFLLAIIALRTAPFVLKALRGALH
ncbi:hypothetical protein THASP1DRAFT_31993 [Thamnocephalis sphaerospora]|uniref:Uncharacterized protein n=1 Tax=Thamnocephalis sphaerospora TaxID=78915 RepID=A0A4P9XKB0_9FUNG|nr:hypothetical protein THASP1DRAFT_31993 [Thamnocephalis sphaerospora]|eukprot:RKP06186.1 hypothetical protein THASP1DRAFT_31993 [Thamnocephalis sphaerospora]